MHLFNQLSNSGKMIINDNTAIAVIIAIKKSPERWPATSPSPSLPFWLKLKCRDILLLDWHWCFWNGSHCRRSRHQAALTLLNFTNPSLCLHQLSNDNWALGQPVETNRQQSNQRWKVWVWADWYFQNSWWTRQVYAAAQSNCARWWKISVTF